MLIQHSAKIFVPTSGKVTREELEEFLAAVPSGVEIWMNDRSISATWTPEEEKA